MTKKKILMCTEFSQMPTGYSVYSKEVLSRLHKNPSFTVAELACYADAKNPKIKEIPWMVFANKPEKDTKEYDEYKSNPLAEFGEFSFNSVLLNFQPDIVFDIRDFWMLSFEGTSPFRDFYYWSIMPTVDATPQNMEWVEAYADAHSIFTYSEFGRDTLKNQSNDINFIDVASPCASEAFCPVENKAKHKEKFGIDPDKYVLGTVMRNQRRKLYPELFKVFRNYLDTTNRKDVVLYCHTAFPDVGWNIPELLMKYNLSSNVLFTYKCKKCNKISCSPFADAIKFCHDCKSLSLLIAGLNNPISEEELASVYNTFDVYVQYANSEGFGMPQLEAAQCGLPVCSVNYSAMESIIKNIGGLSINVLERSLEAETGCERAIPDNQHMLSILIDLFNRPKQELANIGEQTRRKSLAKYNWDNTANKWAEHFLSLPTRPLSSTWYSPARIIRSAPINNSLIMPVDQANFLIAEVLGKPEWIGKFLWRRLVRDLTYRTTLASEGNLYLNENHNKDSLKTKKFSYQDAYNSVKQLADYYNVWETHRAKQNESIIRR
jgi:glycosyltransferase involved in cell wall biosynthesis